MKKLSQAAGVTRGLARVGLVCASLFVLAGCESMMKPYVQYQPTVLEMTPQNRELRALPAPKKRLTVAVYDFPDLTGQYKERETVQSLSRAVTQGGSAMLMKALQDAGERRWFSVLDRSGLQDLARERQIVTEMRRLYRGEQRINPNVLAPLQHAGIILQGGIVGYDTNTQTGGFGARYLGIGGDTQWQLDTVTISLRAVSTETGEVLASVMSQKAIASTSWRGSVFRYVELDKLLELESGVTSNEPKQVAVQQAIEKAVISLIIEGVELGIWSFANPAQGRAIIKAYRAEKYQNMIPQNAQTVVRPATRNPAKVTQTRPRAWWRSPKRKTQVRQLAPAQQKAAPPPPPSDGESLG